MTTPPIMTWPDLTSRRRPEPTQTIRLGERSWEVVDLWLPDGPAPHRVVLMVHGGCWQKAIADRTLMNHAAEDLRRRGLAVWNIEYRGVDEPGGGYPGTFLDVARAADALTQHAGAFGLSADGVVAFGHSAGGHLALWLAARPRLSPSSPLYMAAPLRLSAVVNSGGLADLAASAAVTDRSCLADVFDRLVGAPRAGALSDTSPAELLPLGVLQVCVNGEQDRIAPPVLGHGFADRARAAGDPVEIHVLSQTGHVELIAPGSRAFELQARRLEELAGRSNISCS
jgi:acetyl esterase/lipase